MRLRPKLKLFLSSEEVDGLFGDGKWHLLKAVEEEGSIQRAAAKLGRSYRKAWGDIKRAEEGMGRAIVMKTRGGHEGGRTVLTEFGRALLVAWQEYGQRVRHHVDSAYQETVAPVVRGGATNRDASEGADT